MVPATSAPSMGPLSQSRGPAGQNTCACKHVGGSRRSARVRLRNAHDRPKHRDLPEEAAGLSAAHDLAYRVLQPGELAHRDKVTEDLAPGRGRLDPPVEAKGCGHDREVAEELVGHGVAGLVDRDGHRAAIKKLATILGREGHLSGAQLRAALIEAGLGYSAEAQASSGSLGAVRSSLDVSRD